MSAVLIVPQADAIHVMTDAAFYDETGVLLMTAPKIHQIADFNAVFSSRGDAVAFPAFAEAIDRVAAQSFDEFLSRLADVFATYDDIMSRNASEDIGEIMIAGWSETKAEPFVLYRMRRACRFSPELEANAVYRMRGVLFAGGDPEIIGDREKFDRDAGLACMEAARAELHDLTCGAGEQPVMGYAIGGYVLHAELRADGASSIEVAREWGDEVGETVNRTVTIVQEERRAA